MVLQNIKKLEGGPFGDRNCFEKKSHSAEKNPKGGLFGPVRFCRFIHFAMVRCYQESHAPKKNFIVKSYLATKNLEGSQ